MTRLHDLYDAGGQSPWLDNLRRGWMTSGEMQQWVDRGVRGLTSNPSIFEKAMSTTDEYDTDLRTLTGDGLDVEEAYWSLVTADIEAALAILRPVYETSNGRDGYVSVEVSPALAHDTAGTLAAAHELNDRIAEPNLYIKIPGTEAGLPAIEAATAAGISVNVTLLFSVGRYGEVIDAWMRGLEAHDGDLSQLSSVASFFISRVDTEVDRRLEAIGSTEALDLRGTIAVAQAHAAYDLFRQKFDSDRWQALAARGAQVQRPLWASTSTKNPDYPKTKYVDELIGPDTVNTMPDGTLNDFEATGTVARTVDSDPALAHERLAQADALGVDLADVATQLEEQGVASFSKSFDGVLDSLAQKAERLR